MLPSHNLLFAEEIHFPSPLCRENPLPISSLQLGNGVRKNGVRNRCPYRRCGVDTEIPYWLPFGREFCWVLPVRVASRVDTEFPYRVHIVDMGGLVAATLFADTVSDSQMNAPFLRKGLASKGFSRGKTAH